MVRGVRNTAHQAAGLIAVSTHSSNAELPCRGLADSACAIHSRRMAAQESREGTIGVTGKKRKAASCGGRVGQQALPMQSRVTSIVLCQQERGTDAL